MQQTWAKWTAFKDKVKNKPKALVSCRKKGKKIRSLGIVRKSHKFNRKLIRKILQRVTKSGEKTESHKKVTEYSKAVVINVPDVYSLEKKINIFVFLLIYICFPKGPVAEWWGKWWTCGQWCKEVSTEVFFGQIKHLSPGAGRLPCASRPISLGPRVHPRVWRRTFPSGPQWLRTLRPLPGLLHWPWPFSLIKVKN